MQRHISIVMLLAAVLMLLGTSVLPHHHHDDGSICITLNNDNAQGEERAHNHSHNGCDTDCAMKVNVAPDASQLGHASKVYLMTQPMAIISQENTLVPSPEECNITTHFFYLQRHYHYIACPHYGLRAPPVA